MKPVYSFRPGQTPLLLSVPHAGTLLPKDLLGRLTPQARQLQDTDWHVDRLYQWADNLGVSVLVANYSRYVIDLNRPPDNSALYSGHGTGLVPTQCFDGSPLYNAGMEANGSEQEQRLQQYWQPYHEQLLAALQNIRHEFGHVVLLDAHSIRNEVPSLFEGTLPDLNLGTYRGVSADPELISACFSVLKRNTQYSSVLDGRFQGGHITRTFGRPHEGMHSLQLEMAQSVYMSESPPVYRPELAIKITKVLQELVMTLLRWCPP